MIRVYKLRIYVLYLHSTVQGLHGLRWGRCVRVDAVDCGKAMTSSGSMQLIAAESVL